MRHLHIDTDGIIGSAAKRDELAALPLFADLAPADAEQEIREDFIAPPNPAPRGDKHPFLARTNDDRLEGIAVVKQKVQQPLLERALARVDRSEAPGVTADDVVALAKGVPQSALLGQQQRAWSWVGVWLAQLERAGELAEYQHADGSPVLRRSVRPDSHGNLQKVYLHPSDRRAVRQQGAA